MGQAITVNLDEAVGGFVPVRAGIYPMRIEAVEDRRQTPAAKDDLKVALKHLTPALDLVGVDGEVIKGTPGTVWVYLTLTKGKAFRTAELLKVLGMTGTFDPEDLLGKGVNVKLKLNEYNGEISNKVDCFVSAA